MADNVSKSKRSDVMRAIKSQDSEMERFLRKELSRKGYKFRKNVSRLVGKPDVAFVGKNLVIFLDSCFWHGCRLHCRLPQTNMEYWQAKISGNSERDELVNEIYGKKGWVVLRFWEHELKNNYASVVETIEQAFENQKITFGKIRTSH